MGIRFGVAGYAAALLWEPIWTMAATGTLVVLLAIRKAYREIHDWTLRNATGNFVVAAATVLNYADRDPATWLAVPRPRLTWVPIPVRPVLLRTARRMWAIGERLERVLARLAVPQLRVPLEDDDARVLVQLDADMVAKTNTQELVRLGTARLPEGPWSGTHHEAKLTVEFKHPKRPPSEVWYDEDAFRQYRVDEVPIGKAAGDEWRCLPLKELTPHAVMSATTGWCKTTTANVYIAHTTGNGGRALLNDPKRISYTQVFGGLSNVSIRTTAEGWASHQEEFYEEMERRYKLIERFPEIKNNPEDYFQPWFLVNDERGSYVADLKDWWKSQGEKGMPATLRLEKKVLWQGRAAAMYQFDLAQQAGLEVFIDSDGRDQRMARIASGPQTRSSWMMLFPGIAKKGVAMKKGRAMLGIGVDSVEEIQLAQVSDEQARAFAEAGAALADKQNKERAKRLAALIEGAVPGRDSVSLPGGNPVGVPGQRRDSGTEENGEKEPSERSAKIVSADAGKSADQNTETGIEEAGEGRDNGEDNVPDASLIVGLKAAADFLGTNEEAFRKARQRNPIPNEVRRGVFPAWARLDLAEWHAQRPRAGA
jgi:hypothetical protein